MAEPYSGVDWTTVDLLADIRREARVSDNDTDYTDAVLLNEATQAIWSEVHHPLTADQGGSGWGLRRLDIPASAALGDKGNEFVLPQFATAETISHVLWFDSLTADTAIRLSNIPYQLREDYIVGSGTNRGQPSDWSFRSGRIVVNPAPGTSAPGYVRIVYQHRHPQLISLTDNAAPVTAVDTSANTITIEKPTNWPSDPYAIDIYSLYGPHRYYVTDLVIADDESDPVLEYTPPVNETPVGEIPTTSTAYAALAGQSHLIQLPPELRKPLSLRVASYILRQMGDETRANSMLGEFRNIMATVSSDLMPRGKNSPQRIVNQNSVLRSQGGRGRWRR